jgi:hypothetical protein
MPRESPKSAAAAKSNSATFRGKIETYHFAYGAGPARRWSAIAVPFDPRERWPEMENSRIRGTLEGVAFRNLLAHPRGHGFLLPVNQQLQKKARVRPGDTAEVCIWPDFEDSSLAPPAELMKLFREDRAVKKWFDKINHSSRRYICDQVNSRKSAEARVRCAEQWVECLMLAMEGEIEPPPILQAGFRRQPLAREGWERMTPIQRRNTLIGIFMHRSPESREKRAQQAIADALKVANRDRGKGREQEEIE